MIDFLSVVYFIVMLALLIFVHEFGHLTAAKSTKIKVNEFALGMGPKLFKFQRKETLYSLRAVPIGGFCRMEGEDEDSEDPNAFGNRPFWARFITLFAGSLMNFILAIILVAIIIFAMGEATTQIKAVTAGSDAEAAGLRPGDTVVAIDDSKVEAWSDIGSIVMKKAEAAGGRPDAIELSVSVRREGGDVRALPLSLKKNSEGGYVMGIETAAKHSPVYAVKSIGFGAMVCWQMMVDLYGLLGQLFTGKAGLSDMSGPLGIFFVVKQSAERGFDYVVQLAAFISLNLGVVNLLPLPALDGGRIIFLIIRKITGRRISDETEGKIHLVGFMLLIALIIYVTVIDVDRFIIHPSIPE